MPKKFVENAHYFTQWLGKRQGELKLDFRARSASQGGIDMTVKVGEGSVNLHDAVPSRFVKETNLVFKEVSGEADDKHPWHGQVLVISATRASPRMDAAHHMLNMINQPHDQHLMKWNIEKTLYASESDWQKARPLKQEKLKSDSRYGLQWPGQWRLIDEVTHITTPPGNYKKPLKEKEKKLSWQDGLVGGTAREGAAR